MSLTIMYKCWIVGVTLPAVMSHNTPFVPDDFSPNTGIVEKFLAGSGHWRLAGAGSNGVPPPSKYCVTITVKDLNRTCDCIYNTLNHTVRSVKIFSIIGINERRRTKIRTIGPVIPFTGVEERRHKLYRPEAIYSVACWNRKNHKLIKYNYVLMLPDGRKGTEPYMLLIGVDTRHPHPEIQIGLLTWGILPVSSVKPLINQYNGIHWRYFLEYDELLPSMEIKCATDYDEKDLTDPENIAKLYPTHPFPKYEAINTEGLLGSQFIFTATCPTK